jgi:hypothetical protein
VTWLDFSLDKKIVRDTISIFSHNTCITYEKNEKLREQKIKFLNHRGCKVFNPKKYFKNVEDPKF